MLLDIILEMQLFQINQSEDGSKLTIMSDTTCGQLHQRPITTASLYVSQIVDCLVDEVVTFSQLHCSCSSQDLMY